MAAQLMLLPGLLCDARIFSAQRRWFRDSVAVDGFGTIGTIVAMARYALESAPERISLLGHSMGARVALEIYRIAPSRVERLALISTGVHRVRPGEAEKRQALVDLGRAEGAEALVDRWLPPMVAPARAGDADLVAPLHRMCVDSGVEAFAAQVGALLGRPEVETLLPEIDCPTLVATGSLDSWSPPDQLAAIAGAIRGARLNIIDGAGHMLPVEAPDSLNAAITQWLAQPARP
ncbi:MAG: alpha/beta hydrolase [Sphingomonas sp. 28-66-16]|nr:MAG: alpha/beta hydrolase [Sphingomonas sp. 28-66-16]